MTYPRALFTCLLLFAVTFGPWTASSISAEDRVVTVHAQPLNRDMFDGARHPDPFVPPAAPAGSGGKAVGIKVHLDPRGHYRE